MFGKHDTNTSSVNFDNVFCNAYDRAVCSASNRRFFPSSIFNNVHLLSLSMSVAICLTLLRCVALSRRYRMFTVDCSVLHSQVKLRVTSAIKINFTLSHFRKILFIPNYCFFPPKDTSKTSPVLIVHIITIAKSICHETNCCL